MKVKKNLGLYLDLKLPIIGENVGLRIWIWSGPFHICLGKKVDAQNFQYNFEDINLLLDFNTI